jgi:thymidylate synthase (FAD)
MFWGRRSNVRKVLDCGSVELTDFMGGDLKVVNSARKSRGRRSPKFTEDDELRLHRLMKKRHGGVFESSVFTFHVKAPIFVVRQWQRHRIATYNEKSGRFVKMGHSLYLPEGDAIRKREEGMYIPFNSPHLESEILSLIVESYNKSFITYERLLDMGVARELARIVLPLGTYTTFYFTINARSLMNFCAQRNDEPAMYEIREYTRVIEEFFEEKMPVTYKLFNYYGRIAP